jgi:hypothetical protein
VAAGWTRHGRTGERAAGTGGRRVGFGGAVVERERCGAGGERVGGAGASAWRAGAAAASASVEERARERIPPTALDVAKRTARDPLPRSAAHKKMKK